MFLDDAVRYVNKANAQGSQDVLQTCRTQTESSAVVQTGEAQLYPDLRMVVP